MEQISMDSSVESPNSLREQLKEVDSPLARLAEGMSDRSLERIDNAFNSIGEGFNIFNIVETQDDAKNIFEELQGLTNIDDVKEAAEKAREICAKIEKL